MKTATLADIEKRAKEREIKLKADFTALAQAGQVDDLVARAAQMLSAALLENDRLVWQRAMTRFPQTSEKVSSKQIALALEALTEARSEQGDDDTSSPADQDTDKLVDEVAEELARAKEAQKAEAAANRKKGHGRGEPTDDLPRRKVIVPVPDELRVCPCGGTRTCIGYETSEILELVPAHFEVHMQMREKLACQTCKEGVVTAANPKLVDRLMAGPQLLSHLVVSKFEDHLPLYRLERFYARLGQPIARSTLAGWSGVAADAMEPIVDQMWKDLRKSFLVHADGTGIRVLDRDADDGRRIGTMWAHVGRERDWQVVVFKYATDAKGDNGPWKNLAGREGYTLVDASNSFDRLFNGRAGSAVEVGCHAHARRRFVELMDSDKRAAIPVKLIASLYQIERLADMQGLSDDQRLAVRKDKSKRVVDRLVRWCEDMKRREPPASAMAKAAGYILNQRQALARFLEDARLPLDNNLCEQQIRPVAVGRSNYLFVGSDVGGERAAIHYSILRTCALNGVDPVEYLTDVYRKLAADWPASRIAELTPYGWNKAKKLADQANTEAGN